MNQFVNRIANYVANEIFIKGLSNSRTFQRFAVRTDQSMREMHKSGTEQVNQVFEKVAQQQTVRGASTAAPGPPTPPQRGMAGFASAFMKEIRKDLGLGK